MTGSRSWPFSTAADSPISGLFGQPLLESDYKKLANSGISKELADAAYLLRVDSDMGKEMMQRKDHHNYAGIVFANIRPGTTHVRAHRLRRDSPEIEDGKPRNKYVCAAGTRNMLYYFPGTPAAYLEDVRIPIYLTEGEKKAIALSGMQWLGLADTAERPNFLAVAVSGVNNWRGKRGTRGGPNGETLDDVGTIPDLDLVAWRGRAVTIIFDKNVRTSRNVYFARLQLAKHLRSRGAKVLCVDLPDDEETEAINGVDDLIGDWGAGRVLNFLRDHSYDPIKRAKEEVRSLGGPKWVPMAGHIADSNAGERGPHFDDKGRLIAAVATIGDILLHRFNFAKNAGELLYLYKDGAYRPTGEKLVRDAVKGLLREWAADHEWKRCLAQEVYEWLIIAAPQLWDRPPLDRLNVLNGILNLRTCVLEPHSPEWLSPVQIPVRYDPDASCPAWDKFLSQVLAQDVNESKVIFQLIALLMIPFTAAQRALLLQGPRGTGKSRLLGGIRSFLGQGNVSSKSLHALEENRFASAYLDGKLANICADLPSADLESTSVFKAITGEDELDGEYKHGKQFQFRPFARLLFSANAPPASKDTTDAFLDRWWLIPLENRFQDTEKKISAGELDATLSDPKELSGVLNEAIMQMTTVLEHDGIRETPTMQAAHEDFCAATDPLRVWLSECTEDDPEAHTPCDVVFASYLKFLRDRGMVSVTKTAFGLALRKSKQLETAQRTVMSRPSVTWCYLGIRLKTGAGGN